jgi:predicted histidine transporter YuiF (NhaC family)
MVTTLIILNTFLQTDLMVGTMYDNIWKNMLQSERDVRSDRTLRFYVELIHMIAFIGIAATGGMGVLAVTQDLTKKIANTAASLKK